MATSCSYGLPVSDIAVLVPLTRTASLVDCLYFDSTSYHGDVRYRVGTPFDPGDTRPFFRRGILTLMAIPLGAASVVWGRVVFEFTFYDSMGGRLSPGLLHVLWSGMWAVLPFGLSVVMIYVDWKKPKRSSNQ